MPNLIVNAAYYLWLGLQTAGIAISQTAAIWIVKTVAVVGASMAASKLLTPKMPSMADSLGSRGQMVRSPISARQIIYGQSKLSGTVVYLSVTGTKNEYLHMVIAAAGHEVEEIGDVYFNEDLVLTGSADGSATGKYAGYADIYKKLGASGQTAFSTLVTDTASLTDGKWTSDHKLTGIACVYVRLKWNTEVFVGGIPNVSFIIKGKKVYDSRTATTAYSANPALCLRDYLTSSLGLAMASAEIDDTACNVAANVCDEQVQILPLSPATYENRYEAHGSITTSEAPDAAIAKLLSAMGGLLAYSSGKVVMYAATYQIPTISLSEKHFVGPMSVTTRTSARDRVNTVKGVYVSSENQWQPADFPVITSTTYVTEDNGIKYTRDVSLPFTISPSCAQRLAVIELRRARQEIILTARFRLEAMQLRAGETVMISNTKLGWTNKVFEVMEWTFVADGQPPQLAVDMTLREMDSTVYSYTVSDEIAVAQAPNTTLPNPFSVTAPTNLTLVADGTTQQYQADGTALPRIQVSWSAPSEEFVQSGGFVGIEYKESTATTYLQWARVPGDQTLEFISSDVRIGTAYNVRLYSESYFKVSSSYVLGSVTVAPDTTAPSVPTSLTANIGTGKAVSLDWDDVTAPDFSEYGIYRNTTGVTPASATFSKIAEARSSRFFDAEVSVGTTYYYWVNAYDRLENVSGFSNRAQATPQAITSSPDLTPPNTPSAPTFISERVYESSDGTTSAAISITVPGLPTGGIALDILSRISGTSGYKTEGQVDSATATAFEVDDLVPGISYEFACRAVNTAGIFSTVSTALTRTAPSDTIAPNAPTGLNAAVGTGRAVSLSWTAVTANDIFEYGVYRNTTGVTPGTTATNKIAEVGADRFVDTTVNFATTYYYWVNAIDATENYSAFSSSVNATPVVVTSGSIDSTAPSDPTALTKISDTIYLASDGGARVLVTVTLAALPSGARIQNILYRKQGAATGYEIAGQFGNSGGISAVLDDLTPGVTYDIASQAWSFTNIPSNVVTAAFSPYLATASTSAPAAPSGGSLSKDGVIPVYIANTKIFYFGTRAKWSPNTERDFAYYEIKSTTTDSDSATDYAWFTGSGSPTVYQTRETEFFLYNSLLPPGYVRIRAVNRAGIASSWVALGNANGSAVYGTGTLSAQDSDAVDVTGGTVASVTMNAVSITATKVKVPITVSGTQYRGLEANETTAVDVYAVNLRVFNSTSTQQFRVDNATGDLYVQSSKVVSTRYATTPATLNEVISALQHHGLVP
jgi:hypothetical protein